MNAQVSEMQKFPNNGSPSFSFYHILIVKDDIYLELLFPGLGLMELGKSYPTHDVLKSIQIGLLWVQESPADRPKMSTIVFMLDNEIVLPSPSKPAFSTVRRK